MALLDYFERAYVINLAERVDRRRDMEQELRAAGMLDRPNVEFFDAVRPVDAGEFPSLGARGCFLSHLAILRDAQRRGLSSVLVMEDDLTISPRYLGLEDAIADRLRQDDWAFAHLGHRLDPVGAAGTRREGPLVPVASDTGIETLHFYAVRGPALEGLVAFLEELLSRRAGNPLGGPMHVDGALSLYRYRNPSLLTLAAQPNLGSQRSSRSDITPSAWDETVLLAPLVDGLRAARRLVWPLRFE